MLIFILLKIFFARIIDVSLGTFRTMLTVNQRKYLPALIAFFEVMIWFYVAKEALLVDNNSVLIPISYSLGYATGTFIGLLISNRFIKYHYEVKIINYNLKQINYLKINRIKYYIIDKNVLILFLNNDSLKKYIKTINTFSNRSIIFINKVKLNNNLHSNNIML